MKVKDLINKLEKLEPEMDVLCYIEEDEEIFKDGHFFRFLSITNVSTAKGERTRGEDGVASMKFKRSDISEEIVTLEVTSIF